MDVLTSDGSAQIAQIWNQARPQEYLSEGELRKVLHHDPGIVLTTGTGVVAATVVGNRGYIRLLAVIPSHQGRGQGRQLLTAAQDWLVTRGAADIRWGGEVPYYLWPGLDQDCTRAVQLATACGYETVGTAVNMGITTALHVPPSLPVFRMTDSDPRMTATRHFVVVNWEPWLTEVNLAAAQGTLFVAFDHDRPVSFMAHSTLRRGWLGPMGTDPQYRQRGIGACVLHAACTDLAANGFEQAQIAWVGPTEYFAALGARTSRTFLRMIRNGVDRAAVGS